LSLHQNGEDLTFLIIFIKLFYSLVPIANRSSAMSEMRGSTCLKCKATGGPYAYFCAQCGAVLPLPQNLEDLKKRTAEEELAQLFVPGGILLCKIMHTLSANLGAKFCPACGKKL
jgi:membrane protease subunit (stomatin/prohibitin family)